MKTSRKVDLCLLILPVTVFLPKNVSTSSSSSSGIYFDPSSVLSLPIRCAVTHPLDITGRLHLVKLQHTDGELQHIGWGVTAHWMGSYSTQDWSN